MTYIFKVISSCDIHLIKPNLDFFKKVLDLIGAKAEECIFVDDSQKNVDAAQSLNINSILFKNSTQLKIDLSNIIH